MAKQSVTKAEHRDFELQSSELRGNKNDLSAQLQIQLIGFGTKSVPRFILKVSRFKKNVFSIFLGFIWRGTLWVLQKVVHACVAWQSG